MSQCIRVCVFFHGLGAVAVCKFVQILKGDTCVFINVYQEVYLYMYVWLQAGPLENTLRLQTTPILKCPPLTSLTLAHLSLFGRAASSNDDWWKKKNILIETLTCTGLHTHRHRGLFLASSMCTHTFVKYIIMCVIM